jgi:hypothetical protein
MSQRAHRRCDNFRQSLPQAVALAASMCRMLPECRASSQVRRRRLDHEVRASRLNRRGGSRVIACGAQLGPTGIAGCGRASTAGKS